MRLPATSLAVSALAAAALAAAADAARPGALRIALRRLPFARCQPGRPGASRRLRPQGGHRGELQLLDRGQERDRHLGGEDARRLAHQPAGPDPRPAHELPRRVARGSRRGRRRTDGCTVVEVLPSEAGEVAAAAGGAWAPVPCSMTSGSSRHRRVGNERTPAPRRRVGRRCADRIPLFGAPPPTADEQGRDQRGAEEEGDRQHRQCAQPPRRLRQRLPVAGWGTHHRAHKRPISQKPTASGRATLIWSCVTRDAQRHEGRRHRGGEQRHRPDGAIADALTGAEAATSPAWHPRGAGAAAVPVLFGGLGSRQPLSDLPT